MENKTEVKYIIEAESVRLREFVPEDAPFMLELLNTDGWLKFIGDRHVKTEEEAWAYLLKGAVRNYQVHGFGFWLVETKEDNTKIGMCGLTQRDNLDDPDIGFAFLPAFMGKGYAYESAKATIDYAINTLQKKAINGIAQPNNKASIALLQKIGLRYLSTYQFTGDEQNLVLYRLA